MSVDDPAALAALLPHLASLLTDVPIDAPVAVGVSCPDGELELAFRHLDCTDVVCALGGFVAPRTWTAFGVLAPGVARRVDDPPAGGAADPEPLGAPVDPTRTGPARTGLDLGLDDDTVEVPVVACAIVDRTGRVVAEVRDALGDPHVAGGASQGRVVDTCRRVLGLPTAPAPYGTEVWWALAWVDRVLAAVLDADLGEAPSWPALDALDRREHHARAGRPVPATWEALRRACVRGEVLVPGVAPPTAAWMDAGMFAREAVGAHGPLVTLLGDLRELLPPATFDHVVERVSTRLGA